MDIWTGYLDKVISTCQASILKDPCSPTSVKVSRGIAQCSQVACLGNGMKSDELKLWRQTALGRTGIVCTAPLVAEQTSTCRQALLLRALARLSACLPACMSIGLSQTSTVPCSRAGERVGGGLVGC